jgi:hypothetical protein
MSALEGSFESRSASASYSSSFARKISKNTELVQLQWHAPQMCLFGLSKNIHYRNRPPGSWQAPPLCVTLSSMTGMNGRELYPDVGECKCDVSSRGVI